MGETKVTQMIIRGDLQCYKCCKKIKKTLCKIPQIRDQTYDEKNNKVTITVVCCNPEKIRDKICSKACGTIESIEIVEEKPKPEPKPKPKPEPKPPKPEQKPDPPPPMPTLVYPPPVVVLCCPCCGGYGCSCYHGRPPMCPDGCGRPIYECHGEYATICTIL